MTQKIEDNNKLNWKPIIIILILTLITLAIVLIFGDNLKEIGPWQRQVEEAFEFLGNNKF